MRQPSSLSPEYIADSLVFAATTTLWVYGIAIFFRLALRGTLGRFFQRLVMFMLGFAYPTHVIHARGQLPDPPDNLVTAKERIAQLEEEVQRLRSGH